MQKNNTPLIYGHFLHKIMLALLVGSIIACDSPQKTVKIISQQVVIKTSRFCTPNSINMSCELKQLECISYPPSLIEYLTEKTELISSQ